MVKLHKVLFDHGQVWYGYKMTRRVEATQIRAQETRRSVLHAYSELAKQRCYDQISIAQIAERAGVGKGTVLAHFSEKLAIAATLFADQLEDIAKNLTQLEAPQMPLICAELARILEWADADDVYARLSVGDGAQICRQVIGPSEDKLMQSLVGALPAKDREQRAQQLRAYLVYAVVVLRACSDLAEAKTVFLGLCTDE